MVRKNRPADTADATDVTDAADAVDVRYQAAKGLRPRLNKVFPEHFSFLFGEIALYSFAVLVVTGVYLALFMDPSMKEVVYQGSYTYLENVRMSRAFATTLDISFEVRGGLLVRQIHHWAALIFVAAIVIHMLRIFFTGAFRNPRESNWVVGVFMLVLAVAEGFFGYSLPDDLLSGTGVRIASGMILSVPVAGTWIHWLFFGGEFPGDIFIPRFFTLHVFVIPALFFALIAVHLASVWYQEHTQFPGKRARERNVVGTRMVPAFAMRSMGLATAVTGVLIMMGAWLQINPVYNYGPYSADRVSTFSQPDWYLIFVEGALRLFPSAEIVLWNENTIVAAFWPSVVVPLGLFGLVAVYPFIERWLSKKDTDEHHNLLQRPRDAPVRTSIGTMGIAFYAILLLAGVDDFLAFVFKVPVTAIVWVGRVAVLVVPVVVFFVTYWLCLRLQRADRDVLTRGVSTGLIEWHEDGYFVEVRQRLHTDAEDGPPHPRYAGIRVPKLPNDVNTELDKGTGSVTESEGSGGSG